MNKLLDIKIGLKRKKRLIQQLQRAPFYSSPRAPNLLSAPLLIKVLKKIHSSTDSRIIIVLHELSSVFEIVSCVYFSIHYSLQGFIVINFFPIIYKIIYILFKLRIIRVLIQP